MLGSLPMCHRTRGEWMKWQFDQRWWVQYLHGFEHFLIFEISILFGCVFCVWNRFPSITRSAFFYWGRHTIKKSLISKKKLRTSFAFAWGSASDFLKCLDTGDSWHLEEQLPRKSLRGKLAGKSTIGWRCAVFPYKEMELSCSSSC